MKDDLRHRGRERGAAVFASGEGLAYEGGTVWFACTNGGTDAKGQIWRYIPGPADGTPGSPNGRDGSSSSPSPTIRLVLDHPDQVTVAPWGDLFVCEDGDGDNFLLGITMSGTIYRFARPGGSESRAGRRLLLAGPDDDVPQRPPVGIDLRRDRALASGPLRPCHFPGGRRIMVVRVESPRTMIG